MLDYKPLTSFIVLAVLVINSFLAIAGDVNNPEIMDLQGDSVSGKATRDILWAYLGDEGDDTINAVIGVAALDTFSNPGDIMDFPVTTYELYFSVLGVDYAAAATVPVHGPFGFDISYELRTVQYNGTVPSVETQVASINTGRYDPVNGIINMTLEKADLGNPIEGDLADNTWSAIYSQQRVGQSTLSDPELEDRAPDMGYGKAYIFRGSVGNEIVRIEISTDDVTSANITALQILKFNIFVFNNGTSGLDIDMNFTEWDGWAISVIPSSIVLDDQEGANVSLSVRIDKLRMIKNGDDISIQVFGQTNTGNETEPAIFRSNVLTFNIKAQLPPPKKKEATFMDKIKDWVGENQNTLIGLIVGVIALAVVFVVYSKLKGRKTEEEEQFKDLNINVDNPKVSSDAGMETAKTD